MHDPWFEDFKESLKTMTFEPEPSSSAPCLVAKGAKVTKCSSSESSDDESDNDFEPSYTKIASIATKQQKALEKVQTCWMKVMICWVKKWIEHKL